MFQLPEDHPIKIRAARRKSGWNLLLIVFGVPFWIAGWTGFVSLVSAVHLKYHPEDALLNQHAVVPWLRLNVRNPVAGIFMYVTPLFPVIIAGMMFANFCVFCIPPARRAIEAEDRQFLARHPGERSLDCSTATRDFLRLLSVLLPVALAISLVAAVL